MNLAQEYWWKISLRLKLRQSSGDSFQDFFSTVMEKLHGDDFVRVRPFGQKGDKGCDGYLLSTGKLYQCYGAVNGEKNKVSYLIGKMEEDFEKSKNKLSGIMKEWHMVHNLVDGLPIDAVEKLEELKLANPDIKFGFLGLEGFEECITALPEGAATEILGPLVTNQDAQDVQANELRDLIKSVVAATDSSSPVASNLAPVPVDKLDANELPRHWRQLISGGWQNAHIVASYINHHHDPLIGETIAQLFNTKYKYLKSQSISPASIMDGLYEFVTGIGSVTPARQVAAQALLAHLFESCDIFENITLEADV